MSRWVSVVAEILHAALVGVLLLFVTMVHIFVSSWLLPDLDWRGLVIAVFSGILGAALGELKKASLECGGWAYAFPIIGLVAVVCIDRRPRCPACREAIKQDARVCRHCRVELGWIHETPMEARSPKVPSVEPMQAALTPGPSPACGRGEIEVRAARLTPAAQAAGKAAYEEMLRNTEEWDRRRRREELSEIADDLMGRISAWPGKALRRIDGLLVALAGEGNDLIAWYLRFWAIVIAVVLVVAVVAMLWVG